MNDAKDDAIRYYRTLLNCLEQNRTETAALNEILHKYHQEQGEQQRCIQEQLSQQIIEIQAQTAVLASLTEQHVLLSQQQMALQEQQFSVVLAGMQAQNVALESLTEQSMLQHQQLLIFEENHRAEVNIDRRWGKFTAGLTLINMLILAGMATVFIIPHGV